MSSPVPLRRPAKGIEGSQGFVSPWRKPSTAVVPLRSFAIGKMAKLRSLRSKMFQIWKPKSNGNCEWEKTWLREFTNAGRFTDEIRGWCCESPSHRANLWSSKLFLRSHLIFPAHQKFAMLCSTCNEDLPVFLTFFKFQSQEDLHMTLGGLSHRGRQFCLCTVGIFSSYFVSFHEKLLLDLLCSFRGHDMWHGVGAVADRQTADSCWFTGLQHTLGDCVCGVSDWSCGMLWVCKASYLLMFLSFCVLLGKLVRALGGTFVVWKATWGNTADMPVQSPLHVMHYIM